MPKPVYLTFDTKEEGEAYCARLERVLDSGVIPDELSKQSQILTTLSQAYEIYFKNCPVSVADQANFPILLKRIGSVQILKVDYGWVENFLDRTKTEWNLSPSTIRHHIGSLSRMWDWLVKRQAVATNPFSALRRGYAAGGKEEVHRDRRLEPGEEARLVANLSGDILLLFNLALETAMRMREMYSLEWYQVDLAKRTIFLDKTKNGDKRQIPLSSVALSLLKSPQSGLVFPSLWDGSEPFPKATSRISRAFSRAADKAGCPDVHFHDLRHEATCRLFERTQLSDLEIALITGHRDPRMLKRYANLRASSLSLKLW